MKNFKYHRTYINEKEENKRIFNLKLKFNKNQPTY